MKFHSDERSLDMTRRRRWHREMIPDTFLFHQTITDHSNEGIISNTDVVFRMQSKIDQQQTDLTPTKIKDIKIELNAPRIFLSFKSKFFFSFLSNRFIIIRNRSVLLRTSSLYLSSTKSSFNGS
jgi:hypothetical protein